MKTVGIRELKNRLSEYLRDVQRGEHVLVTDRGEVVGELSPPGQGVVDATIPAGIVALAKRGILTVGNPAKVDAYPALPRSRPGKRTSAEMLDAERGER